MKRALRLIALGVALAALGFWLAAGANRGWTKTTVPVETMDEIVGIEGITYEKRFVPGLDFLGKAALGSCLLVGFSFLFRNKTKTETNA